MEADRDKLQLKLDKTNYEKTYKENERMALELRSMEILLEENKDLNESLERMKAMTVSDRVKDTTEENARLRRRNGELLVQMTDLESELTALKKE